MQRIGVLELLVASPWRRGLDRFTATRIAPQLVSVMPQAVAAWCRRAGHRVHYAVHTGEPRPEALLPDDLTLLFVACHSRASGLAYALATLYRRRGVVTVIGGPHASAFPADCARFFDIVVERADEALIVEIARDPRARRGRWSSDGPLRELPSVEERLPELQRSVLRDGRPHRATTIPLLASTGCPYTCDFCIDWDRPYQPLSNDALLADLRFAAQRWPGTRLGFHDPNFAVRFESLLGTLEATPRERRSPYVMQSSLSILKDEARIARVAASGCIYTAPSLESWGDYSDKAGVQSATGRSKWNRVMEQIEQIYARIRGLQVNFIFGLDGETAEQLELTAAFQRRAPYVLATGTIAMPYGGTPLHARMRAEGRLLGALPPMFYYAPYVATVPRNESVLALYDRLIRAFEQLARWRVVTRRLTSDLPWSLQLLHNVRSIEERGRVRALRAVRRALQRDRELRAFHDGERAELPSFYTQLARAGLGRYAELLFDLPLVPVLT